MRSVRILAQLLHRRLRGRPNIQRCRAAQAQPVDDFPDRAGLPRLDGPRRAVVGIAPRQVQAEVLGKGQVAQQEDLAFAGDFPDIGTRGDRRLDRLRPAGKSGVAGIVRIFCDPCWPKPCGKESLPSQRSAASPHPSADQDLGKFPPGRPRCGDVHPFPGDDLQADMVGPSREVLVDALLDNVCWSAGE